MASQGGLIRSSRFGRRAGGPKLLINIGGAEGDRTPDLMTASHALSQLSYGPITKDFRR